MKPKLCEKCQRKIKGAEYYVKVIGNKKRILLCETCYLDDEPIEE